MRIRGLLSFLIFFCFLFLCATSVPYLSIWHFVDYRRFGAFPEEEHVSLVYVLAGNFMSRLLFMQHFKSILQFSESFFRVHLIADKANRQDVEVLLKTWNISNCEWFFYDLDDYEERVKWIPNTHYSKYYGLSKLLIPEIIPENIGKIMYVDIDIIFQSDIFYLWQKFRGFNNTQSLGMVENLSDWYLNKDGKKAVWPALGRGFNAGIIMMDLDKLRERDWKSKWRHVAHKYLQIHGKVTMSDQDIFNAYVHDFPDEIKTLPCAYNYQLGSMTKSKELCDEKPYGLHFNSQNKTVRRSYKFYSNIREEMERVDGSKLRRRRSKGLHLADKSSASCDSYLPLDEFRVLPNSLGRMEETAELCLVTQFSKDRLDSFLENAKNWNHPISAAAFGDDRELMDISEKIKSLNRSDIVLHMVFEEPRKDSKKPNIYPINFLRNIALNYSDCRHFLLVDVDFMVLGDYDKLEMEAKKLGTHEVLVVPAFEVNTNKTDLNSTIEFPRTKDGLIDKLANREIQMFHQYVWPEAHMPTNYPEWIFAKDVYAVPYVKDYEPYFVIRKDSCPLYDERFGGFGWNKVTHVLKLKMMNFNFNVSPSSFMIHRDHNASDSLTIWRNDPHYRQCLHTLKKLFVGELADHYNIV